jgi:hypothetical protein
MTVQQLCEAFNTLEKADKRVFIDKVVGGLHDKDEAIEVVHSLLETIRGEETGLDYGVSEEDAAELEQRFLEVENGVAVLLDGEQIEIELAKEYDITL